MNTVEKAYKKNKYVQVVVVTQGEKFAVLVAKQGLKKNLNDVDKGKREHHKQRRGEESRMG